MTINRSASALPVQTFGSPNIFAANPSKNQTNISANPSAERIDLINIARSEGATEDKLAYDGTKYFGNRERVVGRGREGYVDRDIKVEIAKLPSKYTVGLPDATVKAPELTAVIPLSKLEQQDLASLRNKYIETRDSKVLEKYSLLANRARLSESAKYDGEVFLVSTDKPKNDGLTGARAAKIPTGGSPSIIFVPGMNETLGRSLSEASDIANATGSKVAMVYHATDGFKLVAMGSSRLLNGGFFDIEANQVQAAKGMLSRPKIVAQVARSMLAQLDDPNLSTQDIRVMCYSQGTILVGAALEIVEKRILARVGAGPGMISRAEADRQLSRIKILGLGAAAAHRDFPERFQKSYVIVDDVQDVVSNGRQVNNDSVNPGNAAVQAGRANFEPNSSFYHASYWSHSRFTKGAPYNDRVPGIIAFWDSTPVGIRNARVLLTSIDSPREPKGYDHTFNGTSQDRRPFSVEIKMVRDTTGRVMPTNTSTVKF